MDPTGKFAYVVNEGSGPTGSISTYTIDAMTGALTSTGNIAAGTLPVSVAMSPSGKFAYVANLDSDTISMYSIDPGTGSLTSMGTITSVTEPGFVVVHPSGKFAYVANYGDDLLGSIPGSVSMYKINGDGTLASIASINEALVGTTSVAVHPSGKFAYVANHGSSDVSMYKIDPATGALSLIGTISI